MSGMRWIIGIVVLLVWTIPLMLGAIALVVTGLGLAWLADPIKGQDSILRAILESLTVKDGSKQ